MDAKEDRKILVKLTAIGSVSIPQNIRKKLDLKQGDRLRLTATNGQIVLTPVELKEREYKISNGDRE